MRGYPSTWTSPSLDSIAYIHDAAIRSVNLPLSTACLNGARNAPREGALSDDARLTSVCLTSVYREHRDYKSRTERHRKTKIGTEVAHVTQDLDTTFKAKRSKVNLQGAGHIVAASRTACSGMSSRMGGATVLKVGGQFSERSEQKNFLTPTFWPLGEGQNIACQPISFV